MTNSIRLRVQPGYTVRRQVGCGKLYVTVSHNGNKIPNEVIVRLGKAGQCASCQNQALGRAISIGLQHGVPIDVYVKTLLGIECPSPIRYPKEEASLSCPDAVAQAIKDILNADY